MALAESFQSLGEDLIKSCENRVKNLAELRDNVCELLEQIDINRAEVTREMWDKLWENRRNRLHSLKAFLDEIIQDKSEAERIWMQTLKRLNKIGC